MNALTPLGKPRGQLPEALSRAGGLASAVDLRELRYFAAAARTGNLGRAAQELNVTPPAISQQLRKLEDALGTPLLIRHGRGVTPTPAGACLLERIETVLHLLGAPLEPDTASEGASGTLSLALPAELGALLAGSLIKEIRQAWPGVTLELKECTAGGSEAWLLDRQVDIAVLQDAPDLDELRIETLLTEALGLVASPCSRLAASAAPLRLRDLAGVPLILPNKRHWIRRLLARAGFQRGVTFDVALQADGLAMTKDMVRNGLGCTVLPPAALREEMTHGTLVFRPIEQPALVTAHAIACRREAAPFVRDIARTMGDAIRSLAATGTWPGAERARSAVPQASAGFEPNALPEGWSPPLPEHACGELEFVEGD